MASQLRQRHQNFTSLTDEDIGPTEKNASFHTKKSAKISLRALVKVLCFSILLTPVIFFGIIPIIFRLSPTIQQMTLFMNYVNVQVFMNLSNPSEYGLHCTSAFKISSSGNVKLGVWHIPPHHSQCVKDSREAKLRFDDDKLVILYAHGNSGTRGGGHRAGLYKKLSDDLGTHVIAFDYRGYGDSSNVWPSADGLVEDTEHVYQWLLQQGVVPSRVVLWGHSLGTAVVSRFLARIPPSQSPLLGTVLEAGFTSIREAIVYYPLARIFNFLPYFEYCFVEPLVKSAITNFNTTAELPKMHCPLLILHAKDDWIIPYSIGQQLSQQAIDLQPKEVPRAQFISFSEDLKYGHKKIFLDPNLPQIVKSFLSSLK